MNYYRKLVENKKLKDESYEIIDGKLKQTRKDLLTGSTPTTDLGSEWDDDYVKQIEKNVDAWLKQYHQRSGRYINKMKFSNYIYIITYINGYLTMYF